MQINFPSPLINWSVWDNDPTVSWTFNGKLIHISMQLPPVSVALLSSIGMIAIVGNFDECGSANLMMYSFEGLPLHKFTAPNLGQDSQFGGINEHNGEIEVIIGFKVTEWQEKLGKLDIKNGSVRDLHRAYSAINNQEIADYLITLLLIKNLPQSFLHNFR